MNKKLLLFAGLVFLFGVVVILWYFFYAKPVIDPTRGEPVNPFPETAYRLKDLFIQKDDTDANTSVTEVTFLPEDPLIRVWDKPATGQTFVTQEILKQETATTTTGSTTATIKRSVRATTTILLFVDRETGYLYGFSEDDSSTFQITNTIISGVYDAYIFNDGKRIIMRYYDNEKENIVGVIANIPSFSKNSTPSPLEKLEYINTEVVSVAVDSAKKNAAYLVKTETGGSVYSVSSGAPVLIDSSPFSEWDLSYGGTTLYATTKPSSYAQGVTVRLPSFALVTGEYPALMSNPSQEYTLQTSWSKGSILSVLSSKKETVDLPLKTLASKCAWGEKDFLVCASPKNFSLSESSLPDSWFKGIVSFDDTLTIVDIKNIDTLPLFSFEKKYGLFDVTHLTIFNNNDLLAFTNKRTGQLWLLKRHLIAQGDSGE